MSFEDLKEALDEKFKEIEAAMRHETGKEVQVYEESGALRSGGNDNLNYTRPDFEKEDHPSIGATSRGVTLAADPVSSGKFVKAFIPIGILTFAFVSIVVLIIATWAFSAFGAEGLSDNLSSTPLIPVF